MTYAHEYTERRREARPVRRASALPKPAADLALAQDRYLARRGLDPDLARFNGWYPSLSAGDREARVVIPASPGYLRFWQARAMDPAVPKRYQSPHGPRGCAVIVVYPARGMTKTAVVVEGPMDALAAAGAGFLGVALMGNTPGPDVFDYLGTILAGRAVVVAPDRDAQGAGARWLAELTARDLAARLVLLPAKDLASIRPEDRREALA